MTQSKVEASGPCPHHPGSWYCCSKCLEEASKPAVVAECWTCAPSVFPLPDKYMKPVRMDNPPAIAHCRAAGHDVRPVEVKHD